MFFAPKKKKKRRSPDNSSIINWIIIGVVALAFLQNVGKPRTESLHETADTIKTKNLSGFEDYKSKLFPNAAPALENAEPTAVCSKNVADIPYRIATIKPGFGQAIACGAPAKIQITVWGAD